MEAHTPTVPILYSNSKRPARITINGGSACRGAPIEWSPSVLVRPELMLENMQISLLNISYPDQETGSAKHDPTRSSPMLCDKLDFICAETEVGAEREGLPESVNYSIQI